MIELPTDHDPDIYAATLPPEDDPLLSKMALPLRAIFYPLGFAVEIVTNAQAILDVASDIWGDRRQKYTSPMLQLRIGVAEGGSTECPLAPVVRGQHHLLSIIADAQNYAICDLKAGFAFAWFSDSALQHRSYLRYHFIEAMALVLISTSYATAIHGACISRNGRGMLLCGNSGMGKSSLAYACARAGWTYTSDDSSYLLRDAGPPRIVGNPHQVRFRPTAKALFPELHGLSITPRAEGKPSIEVPTSNLPGIITAEEVPIHCIVFLKRQPSDVAELIPFSKTLAFQRFRQALYPVEEIRQLQVAAIQRLLNLEVYELRYRDLHHAVERLELLARDGDPGLV